MPVPTLSPYTEAISIPTALAWLPERVDPTFFRSLRWPSCRGSGIFDGIKRKIKMVRSASAGRKLDRSITSHLFHNVTNILFHYGTLIAAPGPVVSCDSHLNYLVR